MTCANHAQVKNNSALKKLNNTILTKRLNSRVGVENKQLIPINNKDKK